MRISPDQAATAARIVLALADEAADCGGGALKIGPYFMEEIKTLATSIRAGEKSACDWCGYKVAIPCQSARDRQNCEFS